MGVLMIPELEARAEMWPSLGPQFCDWIEDLLVHGPGDIRGEPARIDDEKRALITRAYELYPRHVKRIRSGSPAIVVKDPHPLAGRRRFKRCALSLRKGSAKTELAAWIIAGELHPDAPVRCVGWDKRGRPIGSGVKDPYIPLVAYTEEQTEELAYHALKVILELSDLADDFDIGLERIMRKGGDGKAEALANAPDARDGARTTFQHFDETHRFVLPRLKAAHQTMLANIPKRRAADAWSLETTTAYSPGEGSVAEGTMEYAEAVADGRIKDSRLFFFHREASDQHDLDTEKGAREAVIEASGAVAAWSDVDGIVELWRDPTTSRTYWERVWLNRRVRSSERGFEMERWKQLEQKRGAIEAGTFITLGFDGARVRDSTALVATDIPSGFQWIVGLWEKPVQLHSETDVDWEVPVDEVDAAVAEAFRLYKVWRLYADPPYWQELVSKWAGRYGDKVVVEWWTNREKATAYAVRNYHHAILRGELAHGGDPRLTRHVGNAVRRLTNLRDEEDKPLFLIQKERHDSPHKIDAAMAAVLSWEARNDAIAAGALLPPRKKAWGVAG